MLNVVSLDKDKAIQRDNPKIKTFCDCFNIRLLKEEEILKNNGSGNKASVQPISCGTNQIL